MNSAMTKIPRLSKSRFQYGLQCHKRLWLECHRPELADPLSESKQALFNVGHQVGELARRRFPGGTLVAEDRTRSEAALRTTRRLLREGVDCLYEPAFSFDGVLVRADVLLRSSNGDWELVEVKATSKTKPEHITDAAIQSYVVRGTRAAGAARLVEDARSAEHFGLPLKKTYIMHLNGGYVWSGGPYDLEELFVLDDVTGPVEDYLPSLPELLAEMKAMLAVGCPDVRIGRHCRNPYDCPFLGHCHEFLPEFPVTDLPYLSEEALATFLEEGIYSVMDINISHPRLTDRQRRVCEVAQSGEARFEEGLENELASLEFPLHFLDFETIAPALPLYVGTSPYQTIPVQWSCHTLHKDGGLEHHEFLHRERSDPRPFLTERLLAVLSGPGTVVSYTPYERRVLTDLQKTLDGLRDEIAAVIERLFDLERVVYRYVSHPEFHGRTSLKNVLPALVHDLSYDGLAIPNGEVAGLRYNEAVWGTLPDEEREIIFNDLLAYCRVDTLAMVRLYQELKRHS